MSSHTEARTALLHGHELSYTDQGSGPAVLFVHGLLGSRRTWQALTDQLARTHRVLAPDLFGHGDSAKPAGDYSLSAHAATLRDLLDRLDIRTVTLVGHSLGGGIAMQFAYLFPDRVARLVLVSSGGLGREVSLLLRSATLPGAELVLPVIASRWVRDRVSWLGGLLGRAGIKAGGDTAESWRAFVSLGEADSRRAFLATTRSVIDPLGQTVTARDHFPLAEPIPVLLVWGSKDRIIPPWHAVIGEQGLPGCRLELFEGAGHFPHLDQPERFARLLSEFMAGTTPAPAHG
ncbi:MAG TPA: alpha/beta fold hydrolase [Jatrophihabitans sp.]|nr:alpha/beta fold hydrolase [Jatrophihabitans sp.]